MEVRKEEQDTRDCTHTQAVAAAWAFSSQEPTLTQYSKTRSRWQNVTKGPESMAWNEACHRRDKGRNPPTHAWGKWWSQKVKHCTKEKNVGYYTIWDKLIKARGTAAAMQMALSPSWLPNRTTQDSLLPLIFLGNDRLQQAIKTVMSEHPGTLWKASEKRWLWG